MTKLEIYGEYDLGKYSRIYPDSPKDTSEGIYTIIADFRYHFEKNGDERKYIPAGGNFNIVAREDWDGYYHDLYDDHHRFYESFSKNEDLMNHIRKFLSKFGSESDLLKHVSSAFGFDLLKAKFECFEVIRDELPDGISFEDFAESE